MPGTCVVDSSPLQYLFRIDRLGLLNELFDRILVSEAVLYKLDQGRSGGHAVPNLADFPWIEIVQTETEGISEELAGLGIGERETIRLAREKQADRVILDDLEAKEQAAELGIGMTGTLGLLVLAKERDLVSEIAPILNDLEAAGMWFSENVKQLVLRLAGEA